MLLMLPGRIESHHVAPAARSPHLPKSCRLKAGLETHEAITGRIEVNWISLDDLCASLASMFNTRLNETH